MRLLTAISTIMLAAATTLPHNAEAQGQSSEPKYGSKPLEIASLREWKKVDRPTIMEFFQSDVYGYNPEKEVAVSFELLSEEKAFEGKAIRKQVAIHLREKGAKGGEPLFTIPLLIYQPANATKPVPVFVGMNFKGNHQTNADPDIIISPNAPKGKELGKDPARGAATSRWPYELALDAGYAVATIYRGDVDPDFDDNFQNGIHPLFYREGQQKPDADEWGTIGAWAWGLSRVMDYIETDRTLNKKQVIVFGHSRLGKTSLWAAAQDERFAIAISNDSGCGGAALSARKQGETVAAINTKFPHWFCDNYNRYNDNEEALMIDQQGLVALIAPRPVYIASATLDAWADPEGEFLSGLYASPVYELYGKKGMPSAVMPAPDSPLTGGYIGYHIRTGKHDITAYDWQQYINFANFHFKREKK